MKQKTAPRRKSPEVGTKVAQVLEYLQQGHTLDLPKAISIWGYIRLSTAIAALRKYGFDIRTLTVVSPTGTTLTFYKLFPKMAVGTAVRVRNVAGVTPTTVGVEGVIVEDDGLYKGMATFAVTLIPTNPGYSCRGLKLTMKRVQLEVI